MSDYVSVSIYSVFIAKRNVFSVSPRLLAGGPRLRIFKYLSSHFILCEKELKHVVFMLFWNCSLLASYLNLSCPFCLENVSPWWKRENKLGQLCGCLPSVIFQWDTIFLKPCFIFPCSASFFYVLFHKTNHLLGACKMVMNLTLFMP